MTFSSIQRPCQSVAGLPVQASRPLYTAIWKQGFYKIWYTYLHPQSPLSSFPKPTFTASNLKTIIRHECVIFEGLIKASYYGAYAYFDAFPSDTIVKLARQDDCFLIDITDLVLELNLNGLIVDKTKLLSRKSMPGV